MAAHSSEAYRRDERQRFWRSYWTSGASYPTDYDEATPERLAREMAERVRAKVSYEPVEPGGAARAGFIAPLLQRDQPPQL